MNQDKIRNFTDLVAWQEARKLATLVYQATKGFPQEEIYGLVSQMRRASVSVSSNIAEGFGRRTAGEKRQFYFVASGSIAEIQSQSFVANDLGYLSDDALKSLLDQTEKSYRILNGLISSLTSV